MNEFQLTYHFFFNRPVHFKHLYDETLSEMTKQVNILFKKALTKAFHITAVIMIIKKFDELLRPISDAV